MLSGTSSRPSMVLRTMGGTRIDRTGDEADDGTEAEQQQQRDQIGERRHGLHQIHGRVDGAASPGIAVAENADPEADADGERHRQQHQRQRVHALPPVAGEENVEQRHEREQRQPPALRAIGDRRDEHDADRPGQPGKPVLDGPHGKIEKLGDQPEERLDHRQNDVQHGVEAACEGHGPGCRVGHQPGLSDGLPGAEQCQRADREPGQHRGIRASCGRLRKSSSAAVVMARLRLRSDVASTASAVSASSTPTHAPSAPAMPKPLAAPGEPRHQLLERRIRGDLFEAAAASAIPRLRDRPP